MKRRRTMEHQAEWTMTARTLGLALPLVVLGCGSSGTSAGNPDAGGGSVGDVQGTDAPVDGSVGDTGSTDGGTPGDVATTWTPDASSPDTPIEVPLETWTWVPFPDSACANGSPAGIGINLTHRSNRLVIFMEGGGACWNGATCYLLHTAAHITDTLDSATFQAEIRSYAGAAITNRTDTRNPFRDASYVYVPYCTGDVHAGNSVMTYQSGGTDHVTYHVGFRNMTSYLRRLARTFPTADRVWLTGSSAGGFGAGLNWDQTQTAFPMARVDLIDDSGPPITPPAALWSQFRAAWNIQFPPGCSHCEDGFSNLIGFYGTRFPSPHRMALLSYTRDNVISTYFQITPDVFQTELLGAAHDQLDAYPASRYFFVTGTSHTMLGATDSVTGPDGTLLLTWLGQMASDDPTWHSVHP